MLTRGEKTPKWENAALMNKKLEIMIVNIVVREPVKNYYVDFFH